MNDPRRDIPREGASEDNYWVKAARTEASLAEEERAGLFTSIVPMDAEQVSVSSYWIVIGCKTTSYMNITLTPHVHLRCSLVCFVRVFTTQTTSISQMFTFPDVNVSCELNVIY